MNAMSEAAAAATATASDTEVGSYFVANYPPFSTWSADAVADAARPALVAPGAVEVPLGLYLHIPFCRKRCHFCYFRVYTDKNAAEVQSYLDVLGREWELYAEQPAIAGRPLDFIYFGGGTPSFLSVRQLRGLVDRLSAVKPLVGRERDHVRVRAGHADRAEAARHPRHGRHAAQSRGRALRRPCSGAERARAPLRRDLPRLRVRPVDRLPADQHRPDRRHARRDRREVAGRRRENRGARSGQRHHLPDGAAVQHDDQQRPAARHRTVRGNGGPLGDQAALGGRGVRRARAGRLHGGQRLHRGEGPRPHQLRLPRPPLAGRGPRRPRRSVVRAHQRRPHAEPRLLGRLRASD